jgi:hypothetical protein
MSRRQEERTFDEMVTRKRFPGRQRNEIKKVNMIDVLLIQE